MFERLPDIMVLDIAEDYDYSVRLQYFGGLSSRDNKTVTITTSWFNADRLMFYFDELDIKGPRGNCSESYLQVFNGRRIEKASLTGSKEAATCKMF